ncbi:MAG: ribosome biogenesis GTP-binding protein YihA/YsxC [Negativicutes bacterium]|nr:ribosome biogenesis GTP-binding protein YihA/YsxC [Negativicutes bacterium]
MGWRVIRAELAVSAVHDHQHPRDGLPQVALVGRSNVGKSSLINFLCRRRSLARVSQSPGKTRTINFYRITVREDCPDKGSQTGDRELYLVDLPGYGYARAARSQRRNWQEFTGSYLRSGRQLRLVVQLVDSRHQPMVSDVDVHRWLAAQPAGLLLVATKIDKLSAAARQRQLQLLARAMPFGLNGITGVSTTATADDGILRELMANLADKAEERRDDQGFFPAAGNGATGHKAESGGGSSSG